MKILFSCAFLGYNIYYVNITECYWGEIFLAGFGTLTRIRVLQTNQAIDIEGTPEDGKRWGEGSISEIIRRESTVETYEKQVMGARSIWTGD
jgi:hypothetical protein